MTENSIAILVGIVMIHVFTHQKSMPSETPRCTSRTFFFNSKQPHTRRRLTSDPGNMDNREVQQETQEVAGSLMETALQRSNRSFIGSSNDCDGGDVHRGQQRAGITHVQQLCCCGPGNQGMFLYEDQSAAATHTHRCPVTNQ